MSELKPCPFCGGEPMLMHNGIHISDCGETNKFYTRWNIKCRTCEFDFGWYFGDYYLMQDGTFESIKNGRQTAIENWNRRAYEV